MDFFHSLEALLEAQDDSPTTATEVLARLGSPSTSIAILDHGSISAKCYSTTKDDTETLFQACSVSKAVMAVGVMKLVSHGKLGLDTPITEYLSPSAIELIATPPTREFFKFITLKQLLSHTSGLSQGGFPGYPGNPVDLNGVLSGNPPCNTLPVRLQGLPGERYSYSGGGISVIQLIVETVMGQAFQDLMRETVFEPLGMKRSFYGDLGDDQNHAVAHYNGFVPCGVPYHVFPELAAAGLCTTPTDLLKLVRAVQVSLTTTDDSGFLPRDIAELMVKEVTAGLALSWFAPNDPGIAFSHGGSNDPGWRCFLLGYGDLKGKVALEESSKGCGLAIMTNSAEGDRVYHKLIGAIACLKRWMDPLNTVSLPECLIPFREPGEKVNEKWTAWKGSWGKDQKWRLEEQNGEPCLFFESLPPIRLRSAAIASAGSEQRVSVHLIPDSLQLLLHLTEEKDQKVVIVWHGANTEPTMLHRDV